MISQFTWDLDVERQDYAHTFFGAEDVPLISELNESANAFGSEDTSFFYWGGKLNSSFAI